MSFSSRIVCNGETVFGEYKASGSVDRGQVFISLADAEPPKMGSWGSWRNHFSASLKKEDIQKLIEWLRSAEALL